MPAGRAWRLSMLPLDRSGNLFATGSVTRAVEPGRVTNQSPAAEVRRAARRTAARGPFARGDVVNFGFALSIDAESLRAGSGRSPWSTAPSWCAGAGERMGRAFRPWTPIWPPA